MRIGPFNILALLVVGLTGLVLTYYLEDVTAQPIPASPQTQFYGHVTLVEAYGLSNFEGCHAVVQKEDATSVIVISSNTGICNLLTSALATGYRTSFLGEKMTQPPVLRPDQGVPNMNIFRVDSVILYKG